MIRKQQFALVAMLFSVAFAATDIAAQVRRTGFMPRHAQQGYAQPVRRTVQPANRPITVSRVAEMPSVTRGVSRPMQSAPSGGVYARTQNMEYIGEGEVIEEYYDDGQGYMPGEMVDGGCGDCGQCDVCQIHCPPYQLISFADMEYSLGIQGFSGVPNQANFGSFGFSQGINWGFPVPVLPFLNLSGQAGIRFVQAENFGVLGGTPAVSSRNQTFWTAGISRRVDYGLQFGIVVDGLTESWYYDGNFTQLRGELGFVGGYGNQLGFRFTANMKDDSAAVTAGLGTLATGPLVAGSTSFDTNDTYRFYYRHSWDQARGGHAEFFGGFAEDSAGVFGADFLIPIAERWALTSNFTYLAPTNGTVVSDALDETWNIGMGLTWYPKGLTKWSKLYHRPLMNVADNGTFVFKRQP